jgi:hypothetical protein
MNPNPLIDADAAARLLGVPKTWIRTAARADRIPNIKIGSSSPGHTHASAAR